MTSKIDRLVTLTPDPEDTELYESYAEEVEAEVEPPEWARKEPDGRVTWVSDQHPDEECVFCGAARCVQICVLDELELAVWHGPITKLS